MALHTVHSRIRFRARLELEPPGVQPIAAAKEVRAFTLFFFLDLGNPISILHKPSMLRFRSEAEPNAAAASGRDKTLSR